MKINICLLFALFMILTFWGITSAATHNLLPEKDTYVNSSTDLADINYGDETVFLTGCDYGTWVVRSYLGFNLSNIPTNEIITAATLHMYHYAGMGYASTGVHVHYLSDDTWEETVITWNTRPDPNVSLSPEISYNPAGGWDFPGWLSWDLMGTDVLDLNEDLIDGSLSLLLKESEGGDQGHNFYSREYTDDPSLRPWLEVSTAPVPLPTSLWILFSGLLGFVGILRKK